MRRPWNITDSPIYSLATYTDGKVNMNICTYAMAVSRNPKMYAVAVEQDTKTSENLFGNGKVAVLQILTRDQDTLIRALGKRSGLSFDKDAWLRENDLLTTWQNREVLKNAAAYLLLAHQDVVSTGDHDLFCFDVVRSTTRQESNLLMFQDLVSDNLILS